MIHPELALLISRIEQKAGTDEREYRADQICQASISSR